MAHILIVEDEMALLNVLKVKLEKEGYRISTATNGQEALEVMKKERPDLLLLDIVMPKMTGFDVLEAMRDDPNLQGIPTIVISNSGQPVEVDRAKALGAVDYLVKAQFDPEDVVTKVERHLSLDPAKEVSEKLLKYAKEVLVIEDDKFLRDLIVQKLKKEGFVVSEAIDGDEGLRKVQEEHPALVLLDLILPGLDGFELLRRMREDPATAEIPVIILSNLGQREDVERGLKLGAQDFLIKAHFTPGEIINKVKSALEAAV